MGCCRLTAIAHNTTNNQAEKYSKPLFLAYGPSSIFHMTEITPKEVELELLKCF